MNTRPTREELEDWQGFIDWDVYVPPTAETKAPLSDETLLPFVDDIAWDTIW